MEILPAPIKQEEINLLVDLLAHSDVLNNGQFHPNGHFVVRRNDRPWNTRAVILWADRVRQMTSGQVLKTDISGNIQIIDPVHTEGRVISNIHPSDIRHVYKTYSGITREVGESGYLIRPYGQPNQLGGHEYSSQEYQNMLLKAEYYNTRPPYIDDLFPYVLQTDPSHAGELVSVYGFVNQRQDSPPEGAEQKIKDFILINRAGQLLPRIMRPLFSSRYWNYRR